MPSQVDRLMRMGLITPPSFVENNIHYEVMMGSVSYGVSTDMSDIDIYAYCIPSKHVIFPHLSGEILGFGTQQQRFEQYQAHHVFDESTEREYDLTVYNIIKFFQLCMKNNPNIIDALFVPPRCILQMTQLGNHVREHRKDFLHKGAWHRFKGYAYSQLTKAKGKKPKEGSKRKKLVDDYGHDTKFTYHIVRLIHEVEQIMTEHDLDLERNREQLKSIRRGEWTLEQIEEYFKFKEKQLEELYISSSLRYSPDEEKIKNLLLECLEMHFGSLDGAIEKNVPVESILDEMSEYINRIRRKL